MKECDILEGQNIL